MKCLENGCITRALYNYKDEKRGIYCLQHKKTDMIDVIKHSFFHYEYSQNWDNL